jgi:hypothetical protein
MKGRYRHLSSTAKDRILKTLEDIEMRINTESLEEVKQEMYEDEISTSYIRFITHVEGLEEVIDNNEQLTKNFKGFVTMHGFEDLYDMYIYAMSCDVYQEYIVKGKDYSKLTPVKRKVTRNGVEREVTVYVKQNENEEDDKKGKDTQGTKSKGSGSGHAREAKPKIVGKDKKPDPKEIVDIMQLVKDFPNSTQIKDNFDMYIMYEKDGEVIGVAGFTLDTTYVKLEGFASNGTVPGVGSRSFFEGIKLALDMKRNFKVFHDQDASPLFQKYDLERKGNEWMVRYKALEKIFKETDD